MKENISRFKIDYSVCKNSPGGSILEKVSNFQKELQLHEENSLHIYVKSPMVSGCGREVEVVDRKTNEVKKMLMFGSNSYLDATGIPSVVEKAVRVITDYGVGSGGVPLLSGTTIFQNELEKEIAKLTGFDDTILFSSGFTANIGVIVGLIRPNNLLVYDRLNHASLIDGALMSGAKMVRYKHNDPKALEKILKENAGQYKDGMMVVTDGVFSMDGDIADIPAILEITKKYNALLLIDDAHATGVIGEDGAGTLSYYDIKERENIIVTGTLSKAIGSIGGFITAKQNIIDYLRVYARSNMYSTSLPQSICAASLEVIKEMRNTDIQNALKRNAEYVRNGLKALGFNTLNSMTSIIPVIVGDEYILTQITKELYDRDIFTNAIFPPVVPPNMCRIRIGVMSSHTFEDCDRLINAFHEIGKKYGLI